MNLKNHKRQILWIQDNFFYEFGKAFYAVDAVYDEFARRSNVAPNLLWILYALNDGDSHTQKDICADWELPKSTVNTIVGELKRNGYVELVPIKGERREMTVALTSAGKNFAQTVLAEIYKKEAEVFSRLDEEDLKMAKRLSKLTALLKK